MAFKNFSSPHVHVASLDSASTPEAFAKREAELGTGTLTCTDHGTLQATRHVYDLCKSKKYKGILTPILGVEAYFRDDECSIFGTANIPKTYKYLDENGDSYTQEELDKLKDPDAAEDVEDYGKRMALASRLVRDGGTYREYMKYGHVTLHAQDEAAFKKLSVILSAADSRAEKHGSERKPLFGWKQLEELGAENITMGSGCLIGMVQRQILDHQRFDLAEAYYARMRSLVKPGNFYAEVFPHVCDRDWDSSVTVKFVDGTEEKFKPWKNLKTDKKPGGKKGGEGYHADALAEAWHRSPKGHGCLRAVMEDKKWVEREPKEIADVQIHEGFIVNECTPWSPNGDVQFGTNKFIMEMAAKYGDKILISDDSHFVSPEEKVVQDIRLGQNGGSWRMANAHYRFSSEDAWKYFRDIQGTPEAVFESWIDNSIEWADKFKAFKFSDRKSLPTRFYPADTLKHTLRLIKKHGRMLETPEYNDRLRAEINLLHYNGIFDWLPYFFIDEEVADFYVRNGKLPGPGRGSAAGLLLSYLLGITHRDPLEDDLSMDRFMTPDRARSGKPPDIDQDLPDRELLTNPETGWLKKRFGDCYAQISVDTSLKLRSAVKDVARWNRSVPGTRGKVPEEIEALTRKFIEPPQGLSDKEFVFGYFKEGGEEWEKGSVDYDPALQMYIEKYPLEWAQVQKCLGLSRQKSRHACAFVIADEPISSFIPLTSVSDVVVTQFTAPSVEAAGGLKMDFLIVNSLNDIGEAIRLIQDRHGGTEQPWQASRTFSDTLHSVKIDGRRVPLIRAIPFEGKLVDVWRLPDDQRVYADVCEGRTETVFQFNTPGARKWLKHFNFNKPNGNKIIDSIAAMAAFTALDRPGPLDAWVTEPGHEKTEEGGKRNMLAEYAVRAQGKQPSKDILPIFDELLPETYGVMVFQEQLQKMYQHLTDCTGPEAEEFRSNVAKKKMALVLKAWDGFIAKAGAKIGPEAAKEVWEFFISWAEYGFNKSHAVCYVVISYACAWLKHHYPLEWWTAVLCNATKKEIDEEFWPHCGHLIENPDINKSGANFQIDGDKIRAPLSLLQGVGPIAQKELAAGRPYKNIDDLCQKGADRKKVITAGKKGRSAVHRGIVTKLICSGVMDSLFEPGETIMQQLFLFEEALAKANNKKKPKPVDTRYAELKPLQRYQLKKGILTAYGEDLCPTYAAIGVPGFKKAAMGYEYLYQNIRTKRSERIHVANSRMLEVFQHMTNLPDGGLVWAVGAYVIGDERQAYHGNKKMMKLMLDIEGRRQEFIKWGDKEGKLPAKYEGVDLAGALVVAVISKWKEDKDPTVDDVIVVEPPLNFKETEDE